MKPRTILFNEANLKPRKFRGKILDLVSRVIDNGHFVLGSENLKLEKNLARFLDSGTVITVGSGHDALYLALKAIGIKPQDEVIYPENSLCTAYPVYLTGAKSVPVDVDENGQMDPARLKAKISPQTKAVILVHLYGLIGNLDEIQKIIGNKDIYLIEDCAQSLGASYKGQKAGTFGDISCYSFYPTKNLGTMGDGGAIWTKSKALYKKFMELRNYGEIDKYWSTDISTHSRLAEIQAGILNVYFPSLGKDIVRRRELYNYYRDQIKKTGLDKYLRPFISITESQPAPHLFVVEAKSRDKLIAYLKDKKIPVMIHYPYGLWEIPGFKNLKLKASDFPIASRQHKSILSLPFYPDLTRADIDLILGEIKKFYEA